MGASADKLVLILGGVDDNGAPRGDSVLYDPATSKFSPGPFACRPALTLRGLRHRQGSGGGGRDGRRRQAGRQRRDLRPGRDSVTFRLAPLRAEVPAVPRAGPRSAACPTSRGASSAATARTARRTRSRSTSLDADPSRAASSRGQALRLVEARLGRRVLVWACCWRWRRWRSASCPCSTCSAYDYALAIGLLTALAAVDIGHGAVAAARRRRARCPALGPALVDGDRWAPWRLLVLPLLLVAAQRLSGAQLQPGRGAGLLRPAAGRHRALRRARWACWRAWLFPGAGAWWPTCIPVALGRLVAVAPLLRPPGLRVRSLRRLLPRPHLRRGPAAARAAGALPAGQPGLDRHRHRAAARPALAAPARRALGAGAGCSRPAWSLALLAPRSALFAAAAGAAAFTSTRPRLHRGAASARPAPRTSWCTAIPPATARRRAGAGHADLEFRFDQLVRILGVAPRLPITVYLFPSAGAKKDLVGAGGTLYAKPWTQEIFVQAERFPARRLRHELVHVFASAFGDPVFGVSLAWRLPLPRLASGLIEGIAEAADYGDPWGRARPSTRRRGP